MKKQYGCIVPISFLALIILILSSVSSYAQSQRNPCYNTTTTGGSSANQSNCIPVGTASPLPVGSTGYPTGSTPIGGNAAGSTAAVVGTLAAASGKTTYICGFNVNAIGGTATVGPIVVAGLVGGVSQTYQTDVNSATVGKQVASASFTPCIPASAVNTPITITTTANGTATAVDVNSWGYQF